MREDGLYGRCRRRFRLTTKSTHRYPVAPNTLDRHFTVEVPNRVWASDITYLWTEAGWLYLCVVLDLFSRRVVGWSMRETLARELVLEALTMALERRSHLEQRLCHSDRGSQYACADVQALLRRDGVTVSMSRKGNCWDNAVVESFFATLKVEMVRRTRFATREQARRAVFGYIEVFYNCQRLHSYLGYLSPVAFEAQYQEASLS
jgi:transposase InsO family protein